MITITLNGQRVELDVASGQKTLSTLLEERSLKADRVAIERNGEIVPRAAWRGTELQSGDRIEIVHFVGGGRGPESSAS